MDRARLTDPSPVTYRQAHPADAEALAACIDRAYAQYRAEIPDLPDVSSGVAEDIANHDVWVAERGADIVGGLILVRREDDALLANLAVDPRATGAGIGRALIGLAEEACLKAGRHTLRLATHVAMPGNIALYTRLGWQETGRDGTKVQMEKRLTP